jgi:hypothetical protein
MRTRTLKESNNRLRDAALRHIATQTGASVFGKSDSWEAVNRPAKPRQLGQRRTTRDTEHEKAC